MVYRALPRIEWAPGDAALVSCMRGAVRIHDLGGASREIAADRVFDARWRDDGTIFAIDDRGTLTWTADGVLANQRSLPARPVAASLAEGCARYVAVGHAIYDVYVVETDNGRVWTLHQHSTGIATTDGRVTAVLDAAGAHVAIGYVTAGSNGRGFAVIELATDRVLDRGWARQPVKHVPGAPLALAFDAAGARLAQAVPEIGEGFGPIRIGRGEDYRRSVPGGAVGVALDRGGHLAAYAYRVPPTGARGRLRVEYLSPVAKGPASVDLIDVQTIEPALPDVVAVAFSRDSRSIACLGNDGAIEVVPVP